MRRLIPPSEEQAGAGCVYTAYKQDMARLVHHTRQRAIAKTHWVEQKPGREPAAKSKTPFAPSFCFMNKRVQQRVIAHAVINKLEMQVCAGGHAVEPTGYHLPLLPRFPPHARTRRKDAGTAFAPRLHGAP